MVFPESSNAWDSLAEVHLTLGHDADALEFYTRSLELDPGNDNARAMLERIHSVGTK